MRERWPPFATSLFPSPFFRNEAVVTALWRVAALVAGLTRKGDLAGAGVVAFVTPPGRGLGRETRGAFTNGGRGGRGGGNAGLGRRAGRWTGRGRFIGRAGLEIEAVGGPRAPGGRKSVAGGSGNGRLPRGALADRGLLSLGAGAGRWRDTEVGNPELKFL